MRAAALFFQSTRVRTIQVYTCVEQCMFFTYTDVLTGVNNGFHFLFFRISLSQFNIYLYLLFNNLEFLFTICIIPILYMWSIVLY
jgi:hypothetical protein